MTQNVAALSYFPATLSWNMTHIGVTLSYFSATLSASYSTLHCLTVLLSGSSELKHLTD